MEIFNNIYHVWNFQASTCDNIKDLRGVMFHHSSGDVLLPQVHIPSLKLKQKTVGYSDVC
jgi:hypothetical protein